MGSIIGLMGDIMKVNGKMEYSMDKGNSLITMVLRSLASGKMAKEYNGFDYFVICFRFDFIQFYNYI